MMISSREIELQYRSFQVFVLKQVEAYCNERWYHEGVLSMR